MASAGELRMSSISTSTSWSSLLSQEPRLKRCPCHNILWITQSSNKILDWLSFSTCAWLEDARGPWERNVAKSSIGWHAQERQDLPISGGRSEKTNRRMVTYKFGLSCIDRRASVCANIKIVVPCHLKCKRRFLGYTPGSGRNRREKHAWRTW